MMEAFGLYNKLQKIKQKLKILATLCKIPLMRKIQLEDLQCTNLYDTKTKQSCFNFALY